MASDWREDTATVAGIDVQVYSGGRGRPLLVLHGGGGNPGWMPYLEHLAAHFRVMAPTHPGFGPRSHAQRWFSQRISRLDGLVWFYHRFLASQQLGPLPVIGLCLGGWLAAEIAVRYPASFSRMVLVGAPGVMPLAQDPFRMSAAAARAAIVLDPAKVPDDGARRGGRGYRTVARDWKLADRITLPDRHNPRLLGALARLRLPTLLVWGRHDAFVPVAVGESYQGAIPGARLRVIERCGHAVYLEKPGAFLADVLPFVTGEDGASRPDAA